jgi:hypothetical protein
MAVTRYFRARFKIHAQISQIPDEVTHPFKEKNQITWTLNTQTDDPAVSGDILFRMIISYWILQGGAFV